MQKASMSQCIIRIIFSDSFGVQSLLNTSTSIKVCCKKTDQSAGTFLRNKVHLSESLVYVLLYVSPEIKPLNKSLGGLIAMATMCINATNLYVFRGVD